MTIRAEVAGGVGTITIDRPEVKNALGPAEWRLLAARVDELGRDEAVRVLVLRGAGGVFSAGGDLKSMPERLALPRHVRQAQLLSDTAVIRRLVELPKPTLAVIEGVAMGAGLALALACDVRLVAAEARLGAVFHKVGLTGDFGILWLLPRLVGPTRAMDLLLRAAILDGEEAARIGLCTRAVPAADLAAEAARYAAALAEAPTLAVGCTKRGLWRSLDASLDEMLAFEAEAQARCSKSEDAREGVRAFAEKRPPRFRGR